MAEEFDGTRKALEEVKKIGSKGGEYWMGRDIQHILGYSRWESFEEVISRAMAACRVSGEEVENHFRDTTKMVPTGSGASVGRGDFFIDRYACYLIAMNGDPGKVEVASAQTYFAVKTRLQEIGEAEALLQKRSDQRERITSAVKSLNSVAQQAGIQDYARFHDAGYRGLYGMGLKDLRRRKGLAENEDIYDRQGPTELAANEFRFTQATDKITREGVKGQTALEGAHQSVARKVRDTIVEIGGTMPEQLPTAPSLKKQLSEERKKARRLRRKLKSS